MHISINITEKELKRLQDAKKTGNKDYVYDVMQDILKGWGPVYEAVQYLEKHNRI